jgi:hypothetical protein
MIFMKATLYQIQGRGEKSRVRYGPVSWKENAQGFTCANCHTFVSTQPGISGVQNRNHCPTCLWSRHLDLYATGDRLSACKALMRPIALTVKHTLKKYGPASGELMLIHACTECEALSINRIAADDEPGRLFAVFEDGIHLEILKRARLEGEDIRVLDAADREMVQVQLFGYEMQRTGLIFHSRIMETA